jgi:hypothetical protein
MSSRQPETKSCSATRTRTTRRPPNRQRRTERHHARTHRDWCGSTPGGVSAGASRRRQMCDDIAVRVENADFRDVASGHVLLPARLSQQCLRRENRHLIVPLARQDRRPIIASIMLGSHCWAPFGSADVVRTLRPPRHRSRNPYFSAQQRRPTSCFNWRLASPPVVRSAERPFNGPLAMRDVQLFRQPPAGHRGAPDRAR